MTEYIELWKEFVSLNLLIFTVCVLVYIVYLLEVRLPKLIEENFHNHLVGVLSGQEEILKVVRKKEADDG